MIDSRSERDHRLRIAPLGCEGAFLHALRRHIAIDDEEYGVDLARGLGFKGASRSIKGLVSKQISTVVSEGQLACQIECTVRISTR